MDIGTIEAGIRTRARRKVRGDIIRMASRLADVANTPELLMLDGLIDTMIARLSPEAEEEAINRFLKKVESC